MHRIYYTPIVALCLAFAVTFLGRCASAEEARDHIWVGQHSTTEDNVEKSVMGIMNWRLNTIQVSAGTNMILESHIEKHKVRQNLLITMDGDVLNYHYKEGGNRSLILLAGVDYMKSAVSAFYLGDKSDQFLVRQAETKLGRAAEDTSVVDEVDLFILYAMLKEACRQELDARVIVAPLRRLAVLKGRRVTESNGEWWASMKTDLENFESDRCLKNDIETAMRREHAR